ncbi:MAG: DMT family transporter [Paraglaciecola sp.]|uniref:DMT family transporter n=1 Tax=Paraglaciecola sp. TaxID=1920173 RepID=UPI00273EF4CE|nr:DMT family transporter [Paraglaciecola sp.]MDP5029545.1 DMT family transporter [Paraglaciecola sp.]MDP5131108.1 DMT family transporter [Paraglaciecola sp.]
MQLIIYLLVLIAGMGLSVEAGLLGPLGENIGHLAATLSIFMVGSILLTLIMIFFTRPQLSLLFAQPKWLLTGGVLGPVYVVALTIATPIVGLGITMTSVLLGQIAMSLVIDHFGLLGTKKSAVDLYRILALVMITIALWLLN